MISWTVQAFSCVYNINRFVFILKTRGVSCEARTGSLNAAEILQLLPYASLPACVLSVAKSNEMGSKSSTYFRRLLTPNTIPSSHSNAVPCLLPVFARMTGILSLARSKAYVLCCYPAVRVMTFVIGLQRVKLSVVKRHHGKWT